MAGKQVQRRRGTTAQHATFIGAAGEVTVDTNRHVGVVHDGATPGGFPMASLRDVASTNAVLADVSNTANTALSTANTAKTTADNALAATVNIQYKADLRTDNSYANATRYRGNFSSGAGSLAQRHIFMTSIANGATHFTIIPSGSVTQSAYECYASPNMENTYLGRFMCNADGGYLQVDKTGSAGYQPLYIQTGGKTRLSIDGAGNTYFSNGVSGSFGQIKLCGENLAINRSIRMDASSNMEFVNAAYSGVTHTFGDNGDALITGKLQVNNGATLSGNVNVGPLGVSGNLNVSGGIGAAYVATTSAISTSSYFSSTNGTAGGETRVYRIRDANQASACMSETETGVVLNVSYLIATGTRTIAPNADGAVYSGWSLARWAAVYAVTGAINTSDQRDKTELRVFNAAEMAVAKSLANDIGMYQWLSALETKGEDARLHTGVIAQQVLARFTEQGLDAHRYGLFCFDEWDAAEAVVLEDGTVHSEAREAGNRYGLRYDELNQFILRGMAENQSLLEARIAALEAA
jgi:hypothetical protein